MNKEHGRAWVAELRSGKYKQGEGKLKDTNSDDSTVHCCLGVLCELAVKAGIITQRVDQFTGTYYFRTGIDQYDTYLPKEVADWVELDSAHRSNADGALDVDVTLSGGHQPHQTTLAKMNDGGYTFSEIADAIETEFKLNEDD